MILHIHEYKDIISLENLLEAWKEFVCGKRSRKDVQEFGRNLMSNIISLHNDLVNKTYKHGEYQPFKISDPKPRDIHKASVRDRLLHHAIYRSLYSFFDKKFIHDSYSCRIGKGTHKAMDRFRSFTGKVSKNHTRTCWVLKCDIRKFFASIDHKILLEILEKHIVDKEIIWLLEKVIGSFNTEEKLGNTENNIGVGLPLGNLTSQLLVNIYMNKFDHFMKRELKVKYYIRYADDFVVLSSDKVWLHKLIPKISEFLEEKLKLDLHPNKVFIKTYSSGIDFLGWVHFPKHRVLRTATKKRMFKRLNEVNYRSQNLASYLGLLIHGNCYKIFLKLMIDF